MENHKELIKRLEAEILKTPTRELRNLLCDTNIIIQSSISVERAERYADNQHYLGTVQKKFIKFNDWKAE